MAGEQVRFLYRLQGYQGDNFHKMLTFFVSCTTCFLRFDKKNAILVQNYLQKQK